MSASNALMVISKSAPAVGKKRQRERASSSPSPPPNKPAKKRKAESSKQRRARRSLTKLKKSDLPEGAKDLKRALELHINLLARTHSQDAIMPSPSPIALAQFEERFHDRDAVFAARLGPSLLEKSAMLQIAALRSGTGGGGVIAGDLARIEDHHLQTITLQLSRYGLSMWCPNFEESAYSIYNQAMRTIALDMFKHAAGAHAYIFLDAALAVNDNALLVRIYDNYVHSYHYSKWKKEHKEPGAIAAGISNNVTYKRRAERAARRGEFLRLGGYPLRVVRLVEDPACASDDEDDVIDGEAVFKVKSKPFRSERITGFVKWINEQRLIEYLADGQHKRGAQERKRIRVANPSEGITTLPQHAPIDFFSPDSWNNLPMSIRTRYSARPLIALPADNDLVTGPAAGTWKTLSDEEFMKQHGDAILKSYVLPTEAEIKAARKNSAKRTRFRPPSNDDDDEDGPEDFTAAFSKASGSARKSTAAAKKASASSSKKTLDDDDDGDDDEDLL